MPTVEDATTVALPILGIAAAAAATFYAVSFAELREKSFQELDDLEDDDEEEASNRVRFRYPASSRQRRAQRKAAKEARKRPDL